MRIADIRRPPKKLIQALKDNVSSATAATELSRLGIRDPYMQGPVSHTPGMKIVGPAVTLQFCPSARTCTASRSTRTRRSSYTAMRSTMRAPAMWWWWTHAATCGAASSAS